MAVTTDVGIEQRLLDDRVRLEGVWFDNRYRNQISTRTTNPATFEAQYFNIGRTHARGLEFVADVVPARDWHARAGYTFLDSEIVESTSAFSPVFAEGQWAFRRPRHSGFVDVGWTGARADVSIFGLIVGRRVDSDFGTFDPGFMELPRYSVWTIAGSYRVQAPIELFARIENLTNADYMEPVGYLTWGRTAHAGIRLRFR
jgi:vitamin B12 transporter